MRYILALILCVSCQCKSTWKKQTIVSHKKEDDLRILSHMPKNRFRSLELELVKSGDTLTLYLNSHAFPFPSDNGNTILTFKTPTRTYHYTLPLYAGAARIKLPPHLSSRILTHLHNETPFTLQIAGHSTTTISAKGASKALYWLYASPTIPSNKPLKLDI